MTPSERKREKPLASRAVQAAFLIVLVVLLARFGGSNSDGIMAAVVVLAAFTVELAMSLVLRGPSAAAARGHR